MYNYVCAIEICNQKKKTFEPFALKVGTTENYMSRFEQLCYEAQAQKRTAPSFSVKPLFIIEGSYNKYIAERIEDVLRLYYLKKLGYNNGYRKDWIASADMPAEYDVQQEIHDIECLLCEWFPSQQITICFKNENPTSKDTWRLFQSFIDEIIYRFE